MFAVYKLDPSRINELVGFRANSGKSVLLSVVQQKGFEYLQSQMTRYLSQKRMFEDVFLPFSDSRRRAWLFEKKIVAFEKIVDKGFLLRVQWSRQQKSQYSKYFGL